MGILTNYAIDCLATAEQSDTIKSLAEEVSSGDEVRDRLIEVYQFAYVDPYRAVTNNKGIISISTAPSCLSGNDWRAISAGAHAYYPQRTVPFAA